jgi:hypothetical protein
VTALDAIVPILATLAGAGITYWLNVRVRRRTYVEDLFNQAIAAVAAADVSVDYQSGVGRPPHLTDTDYAELQSWFVTEGLKNWSQRQDQANVAIARVLPYKADLKRFLPFQVDVDHREQAADAIAALKEGADPS